MDFKIWRFHIHNKEQWGLGEKPFICVHMYYNNGNGSKRIFCVTREWLRIIKNPLGYCGCCGTYFVYPKRRHRNTNYVENKSNYSYLCLECAKEDDALYQDLWDDFYASRF